MRLKHKLIPPGIERKQLIRRIVIWGFTLGVLYALFLWITLPDIKDPASLLASQSTVILDRNGVELYRLFSEEDRTYVPGEKIPEYMKQAIISIEDERFYDRGCLDARALARVLFRFGQAGGASTITRQLARNALDLKNENIINRKLKELILGCQMEWRFEKDDLLELYLNWIPFGSNAYGIEQASSSYFGKSASGITLAESAVLASLPQRPSYFSPFGSHVHTTVSDEIMQKILSGKIELASEIPDDEINIGLLGGYVGTGSTTVYVGGRADQVLRNMQDQGYITDADRLSALDELETIEFQPSRENIRAAHFVLWVRDQVLDILSGSAEEGLLEQGGLRVETTLDWRLQEAAENVVAFHKEDIANRFGAENMALIAMEPESNHILAYVGNMDYNDEEHGGKIDMVQAPRQPGSSFKPFVYATAFQKGYGPATVLWDVPTKIGDDEPQNFDGSHWGLINIRQALGGSRNIPAAKAYFMAGEENQILTLVSAMGAPSPLERKKQLQLEHPEGFDYGWPLALGAAETPLIEMVNAYGTFARGGKAEPAVSILRITDKTGNILYQAEDSVPKDVLDERIAYQITSILSDVSVRPNEFWKTQLTVPGYETAAKTGTSNKCLKWEDEENQRNCKLRKPDNAWVVGYTPALVAGVWAGNANSAAMYDKGDGLNTSSPVWRDFMIRAHKILQSPKTTFSQPSGIVVPQISTLSGELPTECTPVANRKADIFLQEHAPTQPDPACAQLNVDKVTGLLASDACPKSAIGSGSFLVAKSILADRFPEWDAAVQRWVTAQMEILKAGGTGSKLPLPIAPTELCDPSLTPGRSIEPELSIQFPSDGGGASYPSFRPRLNIKVGSSIEEVEYRIDGKRAAVTRSSIEPTLRVPQTVKQSGTHTLEVVLTDQYFNTVTQSVDFTFQDDAGGPQIRFVKPSDDITIKKGETLSLEANADDSEGGVKYVQFYIDDTLLSTKPKEPFTLSYNVTLDPGTYTLRAVATDLAGNEAEDVIALTVE